MTAIAAPVALGFETLLRKLLFPANFEEVRSLLRSDLTPVAWALVGLTAAAGVGGLVLQRTLVERAVRKLPARRQRPEDVERARVGAFLLAASVPQVPAVVTTFAFMFGAPLLPAIASISVVTVAVLAQAIRTRAI